MSVRGRLRRVSVAVVLSIGACAAVVSVPEPSTAQGCAMCATYMSALDQQKAEGFRVSMLFLMAMPFVAVGSAGGWIVWMYWRSRPRRPSLQVLRPEREGAP
jgi:hypothetical protein